MGLRCPCKAKTAVRIRHGPQRFLVTLIAFGWNHTMQVSSNGEEHGLSIRQSEFDPPYLYPCSDRQLVTVDGGRMTSLPQEQGIRANGAIGSAFDWQSNDYEFESRLVHRDGSRPSAYTARRGIFRPWFDQ